MSAFVIALLVAGGSALVVTGVLLRGRERARQLSDILDLPWGEQDVPAEAIEARAALVASTVGLASKVVERFDAKGSLRKALERARLPVRPGEFVIVTAAATLGVGTILWLMTSQVLILALTIVIGPLGAAGFLNYRVKARRKKFEQQFPDALSLVAGSLSAGHTFLRAIQMLCEEAEPPIKEEFARVVYETQLGDPLVDSLERMAARLDIRDMDWVVQAIRVQQTVGGKLADLLHTLADFIRAREEVRREVDVLTAEGRISGYVLGALPFFLLLFISTSNPHYMKPMYHGWGYWWLGGTFVGVAFGVMLIQRMVNKIEV
jgi:tight adherence protein B